MNTIIQRQNELVEEFAFFSEWDEKYEHLIALGKGLEAMPAELKTEANLVRGCQSRVWLSGTVRDGALWFQADSDAIITRGLVALVVSLVNGLPPEEIAAANFFFAERIGLGTHLSQNRANGLASMVRQIVTFAAHQSTRA